MLVRKSTAYVAHSTARRLRSQSTPDRLQPPPPPAELSTGQKTPPRSTTPTSSSNVSSTGSKVGATSGGTPAAPRSSSDGSSSSGSGSTAAPSSAACSGPQPAITFFPAEYTEIKLLGRGACGAAYLMRRDSDGGLCVCKHVSLAQSEAISRKSKSEHLTLATEVGHPRRA